MKKPFNEKIIHPFFFLLLILCGVLWTPAHAKTRWSSLHLLPNADFLSGGKFVVDAQGYFFIDSAKGQIIRSTDLLDFGVTEWFNLDMGYAGGFTVGFKARVLNENETYMPSLAIGIRNIMSSRESNYFNSNDTMTNELFITLAKSVDPIRLRIHAGMQTIPTSKTDQVNFFAALEEYFGAGFYATLEIERRKGAFWPSLFASWRLLGKKLEISAGAIAVNRLFFDKNNKFNVSLKSTDSSGFVRPGVWLGVRYLGFIPLGKTKVFSSIDDNVKAQGEYIDQLKKQVDSLKVALSENLTRMAKVDNSILMLSDSIYSDRNRLKAALFDKLVALKILYESEPFEPEQARQSINRIVAIKDNALPVLKEFVLDNKLDRKIRMLCISLIGEMGGTGASDALLDVLSQSEDPDTKIEILIALGKMKETRALYVMEQLANDPIDVVAFTAQEVLQKLVKDKGIRLSPDFTMRPIAMSDTSTIREEKIPVQRTGKAKDGRAEDAASTIWDKAHNSSKTKPAQSGGNDSSDVWGMQATGKDSADIGPNKKEMIKASSSDTAGALPDTLSSKSDKQPVMGDKKADATSEKSKAQVKKTEKNQSKKDGKKSKDSKKKSKPPPEDKNW